MVQISSNIRINDIPVSFDLTLKEVNKIKPLTSTLKPVYKKIVEGKEVPIFDETELANIKQKPSGYNIILDKSFEGVSDGVKGFFLDFLISLTFINNKKTTPKANVSEKRYFQYMNIDEGDIEREYPNNADEMLKELEDCITAVVKIIGKSEIIAALKTLEYNDFLNGKILTKNVITHLKGLKVEDLGSEKINEVVDEDYTRTGKRQEYKTSQAKKDYQERELKQLTQQYEKSKKTKNPMSEKYYKDRKKGIENIGKTINNKILNAADKSNPIFNPKKLMEHITVSSTETEFSITVDTYEYMKELMVDANMGELGTDSFVYTSSGKDTEKNMDFTESFKVFNTFVKNNSEIYSWLDSKIGEKPEESTKVLEEIDFPSDMIDDVIGLMQNSNDYIKTKTLDDFAVSEIVDKIKEIYKEKEGGDSEYSAKVEGEYGVDEDNTDDGAELDSEGLLADKTPENDEEEKMDFSKQLLKSVLKTITIIKKEVEDTETRVGKIVDSQSTPQGSLILIERVFKIGKKENILEAAISERPESEKREILNESIREVFGTDELGNVIIPMIPIKIKERMMVQSMLAKKDERIIEFVQDYSLKQSEATKGREYGGYTLYSIMSDSKQRQLSLQNVIKELKKEVDDLSKVDKVKKRIQKILLEDVKPIKGLADIRGDILLRLTPVNHKLEVGKMKLNYKYFISKKDIKEYEGVGSRGEVDLDKKDILNDKLVEGLKKYLETYEDKENVSQKKEATKAVKQIDKILTGTQNLKDSLETAFEDTKFFEYTKDNATPLTEEVYKDDLDDFVLGFFYGTGSNKSKDIKTLLDEINRNLTFLDSKIENIEEQNQINIQELVNTNKLNDPKLLEAIGMYIEEIKTLGLPEKYYKEKTVSMPDIPQVDKNTGEPMIHGHGEKIPLELRGTQMYGGSGQSIYSKDITIPPKDYHAYYEYYKVRNEPFIKWFEGLRPMQIERLIVDGETQFEFFETDRNQSKEILVNLRKDAVKYFTKNKDFFDHMDDDFIKDILKTIKDAYIENKELDPNDIDDGSTDEFDERQQMDMEDAQDRYGRTGTLPENESDRNKEPKGPSENLASDEVSAYYAKLARMRREGRFYDGTKYPVEKMLLKADIESGYEDDVFYWMFFWMSDSVRENIKTAFQDYSQLKFTFDDSKKIRLIELLDPDFISNRGSLPKEKNGQYDIDAIKTSYRAMFLEEIFNKKTEQKGFIKILEDISFIPVLKENKTSFNSMDKIDFEPFGQTNKIRSSDRRSPEMLVKPTGRKKQTYKIEDRGKGKKQRVKDKIVDVVESVEARKSKSDRVELINLLLPANSRWSSIKRKR